MSESENNSGFGFKEVVVLVCIIGFLAWVAKPNFISNGHHQPQFICINNLRQIDGAINEWALEKGKTNGAVVVENEIKAFIKLGPDGQLPKCPLGGKYVFGKIGIYPQVTCSLGTNVVPAHVLP
jgi:hypothetical protein